MKEDHEYKAIKHEIVCISCKENEVSLASLSCIYYYGGEDNRSTSTAKMFVSV